MHVYRTRTRVQEGHRVTVDLPSDFSDGEVEVIVLPVVNGADDERSENRLRTLSVDELLANRLARPSDVAPVSLTDMQGAIVAGALGRGDD